MELTKEEILLVEKHLDTIQTIIVNHSCSYISPEFRSDIKTISDNHKLTFCLTCNSGLWNTCSHSYSAYKRQNQTKNTKKSNKNHETKKR